MWCSETASKVSPGLIVDDFQSSFQDGRVLASVVASSDPSVYTELLELLSDD